MSVTNGPAILYPMFALAAWTAFVQLLIPLARTRSGLRGEIRLSDFEPGESAAVPQRVSIPNRNYMNLLESPNLFYVACIVFYVTDLADTQAVAMAWVYVALRIAHSVVHLTYNKVMHRLTLFALSNFVLGALWVKLAATIW